MRAWLLAAAAGAIGGSALPSWADTSLQSFDATVTADEVILDDPELGTTGLDREQKRKDTLDRPDLATFTDTATKATGLAEIEVTAQVQGNALTVDFMSRAEGVGAGAANGVGSTQSASGLIVRFTTTTDRLPWTLEGIARRDGPGTDSATAQTQVRLLRVGGSGTYLSLVKFTDTVGDEVISESGVLPAGTYDLALSAVATPQEQTGAAETVLDVTFRIGSTPVAEDPIEWKEPRSGSFGDAVRWDPEQVPTTSGGRADVASFDVAGSREYRVTMETQHTTAGLFVGRGFVHFLSGRLSVVGYEPDVAAMEVRNDAFLTIGNDMELAVRDAIVSGPEGGDFDAAVHVIGDGAFWNVTNELQVGFETESGVVTLERGTVNCGRTLLGHRATSEDDYRPSVLRVAGAESIFRTGDAEFDGAFQFDVDDGGEVQSDRVTLGPTGIITRSTVTGRPTSSSETQSTWRVQRFVTAPEGLHYVFVNAGGRLEVVEDLSLARSYVTVQRPPAQVRARDRRTTSFSVGGRCDVSGGTAAISAYPFGMVFLDGDVVMNSGSLMAEGGLITLTGLADGVEGEIRVGTVPDTAAGRETRAYVTVTEGGHVDTSTPGRAWRFGTAPESYGALEIGGSGLGGSLFVTQGDIEFGRADGSSGAVLIVHGGGRIETSARIVAHPSAAVSGDGAFVGEFVTPAKPAGRRRAAPVFAAAEIACSEFEHHGTLTARALRIEGDLTVAPGAVVVTEIGGPPSEDRPVPLTVTGTAALAGKLVLQFAEGYAPRAGEAVEFLDVQGAAATGTFTDVEVRGLAPGAQFDVAADGAGRVAATAVADTAALPSVSVKARGKKVSEKKAKKPAVFTFTRTGPTDAPLDVAYSVGGTATSGDDFAAVPGVVTIPAGKKAATVSVQVTNDALPESEETVDLRVEPGPGHTRGRTSRAAVTIADDDAKRTRGRPSR